MPLILTWTGERFRDREGAEGLRGRLVLGPLCLHALKRGDSYVDLPAGRYRVEMQPMRGSGRRALRVLPSEDRPPGIGPIAWDSLRGGRIYVHAALYPSQLEGCLAPGLEVSGQGLVRSTDALNRLIEALGGWRIGRAAELWIRAERVSV